jgi:hypothetical protein
MDDTEVVLYIDQYPKLAARYICTLLMRLTWMDYADGMLFMRCYYCRIMVIDITHLGATSFPFCGE